MSEFGLSRYGFIRKRYADIWQDMAATARSLFGDEVNLTEQSPLGMFLRINAWEIANAWQVAEDVYYSAFVDFSEGHQLDLVCQYIGIERLPAQRAEGEVTFAGVNATIIPAGFRVATTENVIFETTEQALIAGGFASADIIAIEPGEDGNVPAGTIVTIVSGRAGVASVTNAAETLGGRDVETDYALRERYKRSVQNPGQATAGAIEAALLNMPEVWDAYVRENDTNGIVTVGTIDLPPKCIYPLVHMGADADIAATIFATKAGGIQSFGTPDQGVFVEVADSRGILHQVGFDRPITIVVCIDAEIVIDEQFDTVNGYTDLSDLIIDYINALGISRNVIYTQIVTIIQNFPGTTDVESLNFYVQAEATVESNLGATVLVTAAFLTGLKGTDGDGVEINFEDVGSGGISASYDSIAKELTINYGGEVSITANQLQAVIQAVTEFDAVVMDGSGDFLVGDDLGIVETLANGADYTGNVAIDIREVSMPGDVVVVEAP